jgi:hypothetical protein
MKKKKGRRKKERNPHLIHFHPSWTYGQPGVADFVRLFLAHSVEMEVVGPWGCGALSHVFELSICAREVVKVLMNQWAVDC